MDASSLSHGVPCAPYLAFKHVAGSDQPVLYNFSEKKVDDVVGDVGALANGNCWATPQGWILVRDAPSLTTYLVDPRNPSGTGRIPLPHLQEENRTCRPTAPACCPTTQLTMQAKPPAPAAAPALCSWSKPTPLSSGTAASATKNGRGTSTTSGL